MVSKLRKIMCFFRKDLFLWKDFFKSLRKDRNIAFVIDNVKTYNTALASIRLRCYDIINFLEENGIKAELYKENKKYDIVIFTKTTSDRALEIAENISKQGIPIIYDAYCDYFGNIDRKNDIEHVLKITSLAQAVITCSEVQKKKFMKFHHRVFFVPEGINIEAIRHYKVHNNKSKVTLVYCGYAVKSKDTLYIKDVLKKLQQKNKCDLIYICERNPQIRELNYKYIKYNQRCIGKQLCQGDIMIAPRDILNRECYSHSFTKIALPMAVGLPVVASPIPSYIGSPALLCNNDAEWEKTLNRLIDDYEYRKEKAVEGMKYIQEKYILDVIGKQYVEIIEEIK